MAIDIKVATPEGLMKKFIGTIHNDKEFVKAAQELNLACLSFLPIYGNLYFNHKQLKEIDNELNLLERNSKIDENILSNIKDAIYEVRKSPETLLMFEGE